MKSDFVKFFSVFAFICFQYQANNSASAQTVSNVTAEQIVQTIHISYDLDKKADISVFVSTSGGKSYTELKNVSGAVGENVYPGHNTIVWFVIDERGRFEENDVTFLVRANNKNVTENNTTQYQNSNRNKSAAPADTTNNCPATVKDYDGNIYKTVKLGNQCWMAENLRTTHYADGGNIDLGYGLTFTGSQRYYPNNDKLNVYDYGYLYNWNAVMHHSPSSKSNPSGVQGICPNGWHVPSNSEWSQLNDFVSSQENYVYYGSIAKSLAAETGWEQYSLEKYIGYEQINNNSSGFNAKPAGYSYDEDIGFFGEFAIFWSTTEHYSDAVIDCRILGYNLANFLTVSRDKFMHMVSVRCLKD